MQFAAAAAAALEGVVPLLELVTLLVELAVPFEDDVLTLLVELDVSLEDDVLTLLVEVAVAASAGVAATDATVSASAPALSRPWARRPKRCVFIGRTYLPW
ncbi:MAG: hypothetical protein ACLP01_22145 [Solirubrobacteraceae bacterium]